MWFHISDLTFLDPCWTFFLKSKDTQYLNSKLFQWSLRSERGRNLSWENLVSYYLDNDAARSTSIRASASTSLSTTLVADYVDLNTKAFSLIGLQSCQPQQPSRSTIPLRFSPICLRDAETFELVLPAHLSQWGINGCTDFGET